MVQEDYSSYEEYDIPVKKDLGVKKIQHNIIPQSKDTKLTNGASAAKNQSQISKFFKK
jgi:hypothetical protein